MTTPRLSAAGDPASSSPPGSDGTARRRRIAAWATTYLLFVLLMGGTVPTPIYALYGQRLGLSSLTVSGVFSCYAVGTLSSLLLFGGVSDRIGRRATLAPALGLALASCLVFALSPTLPGIVIGRLLCGLAVGLATGAATAYLGELLGDRSRAALTTSVTNMAGLGVGPLLSGVLVQYGPDRLVTSYLVWGALLLPGAVLAVLPETVRRTGRSVPRQRRLGVPAQTRPVFAAAAVAVFSSFALLGLLAALAGKFLAGGLHETSHLLAGVAAFCAFGPAAVTQLFAARLTPRAGAVTGMVAVPAGLGLIVAALPATSLALFLAGSVIGGAGSGLAFRAGLALVTSQAPADRVGQVVSSYFVAAYLGLTVPVVGVGLLVTEMTLLHAAVVFAVVTTLLAAVSVATTLTSTPRRTSHA